MLMNARKSPVGQPYSFSEFCHTNMPLTSGLMQRKKRGQTAKSRGRILKEGQISSSECFPGDVRWRHEVHAIHLYIYKYTFSPFDIYDGYINVL